VELNSKIQNDVDKGITERKIEDEIIEDICLNGLSFSYSSKVGDRPVLDDISLKIHGAQLVSVLGPNGVGKSTLIHCMNRILTPTDGTVSVNGVDVQTISLKKLAKIMGYVPYKSADSFPLSVTDTILMGRHPHSKWGSLTDDLRIVHKTLNLIGIEDLAERSFNELSAGQHQKVMLARGLAQQPKVMFLDEPTSNLDIKYQLEITRLLRKLAREKRMIVVMISHDINIAARYSDNILLMSNGGIYAVGRPEDVITAENISKVYDVKCNVEMYNGRPHVFLIDGEEYEEGGDFHVLSYKNGEIYKGP
jgi:iron complex transport system ATP-binding protein